MKQMQAVIITIMALMPLSEIASAPSYRPSQTIFTDPLFALQQMAEQGLPVAQWQLSIRYAYGLDVEPSCERALYWCRLAAIQGCVEAQVFLAQLLAKSNSVEAQQEAFTWLYRAAQDNFAEGQYLLAEAYLYGHGVEKDISAAEAWATKADAQGYGKAKELLAAIIQQQEQY